MLDERVDIFDFGATTSGDASFAAGVGQQIRVATFFGCHRKNNRFDALDLALVHRIFKFLHLAHLLANARNHAEDLLQRAKFPHRIHRAQKILEIEGAFSHLLFHFLGFVFIIDLFGAFDQRHHVAHAQNALGKAVGMKRFKRVGFFACTKKLDRYTRNFAHRKRRATTGITVHFGHNQAGEWHFGVEGFGHFDRFLADHRIHDQHHFVRLNALGDSLQLGHQAIINLQASGGINNHQIVAVDACLAQPVFHNVGRRNVRAFAVHGDIQLFAQRFKLLDRGGSVDVSRNQQWHFAFFTQMQGQFRRHRGFARALQTNQHNNRRLIFAS